MLRYELDLSSKPVGALDVSTSPFPGFMKSNNGVVGTSNTYTIMENANTKFLRFGLYTNGVDTAYRTELGSDWAPGTYTSGYSDGESIAVEIDLTINSAVLSKITDGFIVFQIHQVAESAPTFSPPLSIALTQRGYQLTVSHSEETTFSGNQRRESYSLGGYTFGARDKFLIEYTAGRAPNLGSFKVTRNGILRADNSLCSTLYGAPAGDQGYLKFGIYAYTWSGVVKDAGYQVEVDYYSLRVADSAADLT